MANNAAFEERRRSALLYEREMAMREKEHIDNMYKISTVTIDNSKEQEKQLAQQRADAERKAKEQALRAQQIEAQRKAKEEAERKAYEERMWRQNAFAPHCVGITSSNSRIYLRNTCNQAINIKYVFTKSKPFSGNYSTLQPGGRIFDGAMNNEGYQYVACFVPAVPQSINGGCV